MSDFSDTESDQSEFDSELDLFLRKMFVDDDGDDEELNSPMDMETHLTSHVLESLGALLQTVVKSDKALKKIDQNNPDLSVQQAKRQALGCALRYFADKLQTPVAPPFSEPYPEKWLHSSFPDSNKLNDGNTWLPLHWLVKASTKETCNDNPEVIRNMNLVIADLKQLQEDLQISNNFHCAVAPLSVAVAQAYPSIDVVKCLCAHYPKALQAPDADGAFPFFYACAWNKEISIVQYLHGEYPNIVEKQDNYGFRALHYAAYVGTADIVQFLLAANPGAAKQSNKHGVLPLNACIVNPNSDVNMVRSMHAVYPKAIRIPDNEGLLPIHKAVQHSNLDVIKYLVESYPESTLIPDHEGLLPLHYSGTRKDKSVVIQEYVLAQTPEGGAGDKAGAGGKLKLTAKLRSFWK
mmetsp:Transcript_7417/g.12473  ORF Transcript_7417/g.12473 Transcript_7417/m.12473 type:complete len:407 (-) Transcript_7417:846-2066(-)